MINEEDDCRLAFRKFNRFYTDVLGFLNEHIYDSPFSLTETRILFEIYNTSGCMAKDIQQNLNLDGGYVSRIIKKFEKEKMIYKQKSKEDARNHYLFVTSHGEIIYKELEKKANQQVDNIMKNLGQEQQQKLIASMNTIQDILFSSLKRTEESISVRSYYTSGDLKNMLEQQWEFYNRVHKWDESFLAYLHETFEAEIERIWIAEINGQFAGSIGLVNAAEKVGQLRWFFVNPSFQNKGLGTQLIKSLIQYCKHFNYERIFLWTVSDMKTARPLYKKMGFDITEEKAEIFMWGRQLIEERWDLELRSK